MTFDDLLAQVQALLQREQRLSYRALQRRFALEEVDLEALKDELIYAKRLAVDEDDRVLVWAGDAGTTPAPASQALQSTTTHADSQTGSLPHTTCPQSGNLPRRRNAASSPSCSATWWPRQRCPGNSTRRTTVPRCGPTRPPVPRSSGASMGTLPSTWGMACWSTLAIRWRTKTTRSAPCGQDWRWSRPWGHLPPAWSNSKAFDWLSALGFILVRWWWVRWEQAADASSLPWARRRTWRRASRVWRPPILWSSALRCINSCRATLFATI